MRCLMIFLAWSCLAKFAVCGTGIPCVVADRAPDAILLRQEPSARSKVLGSVPKDAGSFVALDAVTRRSAGEWLKVAAGRLEGWVNARWLHCRLSPERAKAEIAVESERVIQMLKERNLGELAKYAHPVKGIRFSPYATVDPAANPALSAAQIRTALQDPAQRVWGYDDGSGDAIRLTFAAYYRRFVYDRDYAKAPEVRYNSFSNGGGSNNIGEEYPNAVTVEYHCQAADGGASGTNLRVVFELQEGQWYLVAIVHDEWTI